MEVVIIGKNEGASVNNMIYSLPKEWDVYYVADRCTDNTIDSLQELQKKSNLYIIQTPENLEGRQTSYCRNLGASFCNREEGILFLDGDRYIIEGDIKESIKNAATDILLFRVQNDFRTFDNFALNYGNVYNGFFSCGIWFSKDSLNKILAFQNNQIFSEEMQKYWGIEDTYLGDVCYHLGLTASLNESVSLNGVFERNTVDSLDVIEMRLKARNLLNVKWI